MARDIISDLKSDFQKVTPVAYLTKSSLSLLLLCQNQPAIMTSITSRAARARATEDMECSVGWRVLIKGETLICTFRIIVVGGQQPFQA